MARQPILSEEDYQKIVAALDGLEAAQEEITRAKQAGLDVGAQETRARSEKERLLAIKRAYFPNR